MKRGTRQATRLLTVLAVLAAAGALVAAAGALATTGPGAARSTGLRAAFSATDDAPRPGPRAGARDFLSWDWRHCAQVLADLQAAPPRDKPLVILLGGSAARECTVSDADWQSQLARRAARSGKFAAPMDATIYNLGSKHRTFALDLAMIRRLPKDVPTILYIGINLGEFCAGWSSTAFTLPPAVAQPRSYNQHIYSVSKRVQSRAAQAGLREVLGALALAGFPRPVPAPTWPSWRPSSRRAGGPSLHPVLLDLPRDMPIIGHAFDAPIDLYHLAAPGWPRKYGVPWINFVAAARFVDGDFFDIFHTVEPGRVKYQRLLSDTTVTLLDRYGMTPTPTPSPTPTPTPPTPTPSPTTATPTPSPERLGDALTRSPRRRPGTKDSAWASLVLSPGGRSDRAARPPVLLEVLLVVVLGAPPLRGRRPPA